MNIFQSIMSKIFPSDHPALSNPAAASASSPAAVAEPAVDVTTILESKAAQRSEKLDWHHSIVDLLKVLELDSSLAARKKLAHELNYTGDTNDSASMNTWLHQQVMQKLAQNGGTFARG